MDKHLWEYTPEETEAARTVRCCSECADFFGFTEKDPFYVDVTEGECDFTHAEVEL